MNVGILNCQLSLGINQKFTNQTGRSSGELIQARDRSGERSWSERRKVGGEEKNHFYFLFSIFWFSFFSGSPLPPQAYAVTCGP
ncbi:uncharacterized protein BDW47DRAFT_98511 [Aspergillus candidus]|uniref:Uncharacterized protein n=1 Tax=Aspergillus candidus TaxID=41067 RepID=A0A2I2FM95_ASPCN|nr:hypothetical protein BDW47DRAFT_98511 [Aspergillus candidus]PLB41752.1 hypothetical protein BDW47DRAFT_98511 [Aspergillus candidus]